MCLLSRFPCRFEIQDWTDAAKRNLEKGRKKEESSEARMNRFFFFVPWPGGRLLELGDESRRRPLIYCTVHCCRRWIAPDSLSLSLSYFLCFSPPCPWASDASGSGVVECWEDQSGRRPLTGVETHEEVREGYDAERYENRARLQKKEKKEKCLRLVYFELRLRTKWNIYQTPEWRWGEVWQPAAKIFNLSHRELRRTTTLRCRTSRLLPSPCNHMGSFAYLHLIIVHNPITREWRGGFHLNVSEVVCQEKT